MRNACNFYSVGMIPLSTYSVDLLQEKDLSNDVEGAPSEDFEQLVAAGTHV